MTRNAATLQDANPEQLWWAPVWERHAHRYELANDAARGGEASLRRELVFCLLGGHGVSFELATSATRKVLALRPFDEDWTPASLRRRLELELSTPQFEPVRRDGELRRYRFPARKAQLVADATHWVREQGSIRRRLVALEDEQARRDWLCRCPGVGMKTASWVLRNCGWAQHLAILDVHLVRALTEAGVISEPQLPRDYLTVEDAYLQWAHRLGACPAALDLFLWEVQRVRRRV